MKQAVLDSARSLAVWIGISFRSARYFVGAQFVLRVVQSAFASLQPYGIVLIVDSVSRRQGAAAGLTIVLLSLAATFMVQVVSGPLTMSINE
ncbi:MAG TPA: hypothetical protein VN714_00975, partial [Trebonia sp.]|nr:hypothetical protein [Trebonia sp.]